MKERIIKMLSADMEAKRTKALMSLDLLLNNPVGIGDHSTGDFYDNAIEALKNLAEADDCIETLRRYTDGQY